MTWVTQSEVSRMFVSRQYRHLITIKPDPKKCTSIDRLRKYLDDRECLYWLVYCKSAKGFLHWHGIISFDNDASPDDISKFKTNMHRLVNRLYGSFTILPVTDLNGLYHYIRSPERNDNQGEYYSKCLITDQQYKMQKDAQNNKAYADWLEQKQLT